MMHGVWESMATAPTERCVFGSSGQSQVTLYSSGLSIIWHDCRFSEKDGKWVSRNQYVDSEGLRCTRFDFVEEPTHWTYDRIEPPQPNQLG